MQFPLSDLVHFLIIVEFFRLILVYPGVTFHHIVLTTEQ